MKITYVKLCLRIVLYVLYKYASIHKFIIILVLIGNVNFIISILKGTGNFEICEGDSVAAIGRIFIPDNIESEQLELPEPYVDKNNLSLTTSEIYKDFRLRGFDYKGVFKSLKETDNKCNLLSLMYILCIQI